MASDVIDSNHPEHYPPDLKIVTKKDTKKTLIADTDMVFYDTIATNGMLSDLNSQSLIFLQTTSDRHRERI